MLDGCVPWPAEAAREYRRLGLCEDLTVAEMVGQFDHPRRFMQDFPISPLGKLLKRALRDGLLA